jgi:hypothetical protein
VKQAADFLALDRAQLAAALAQGHTIASDALANRVYRGVSLGLPDFVDRLAWKTFAKVFLRDRARKVLRGWNLRLEQTGLDGPLVPRQRRGVDFHFGHFRVEPAAGYALPRPLPQALVLDYGLGGNPRLDPSNRIRDPIVAVNEGSAELLLGWTYLDLGAFRVGTPSYFTLEAVGPIEKSFEPPRRARVPPDARPGAGTG